MKKLFIYYSQTGNGDLVSKKLEGYDLRKVEMKKKMPKSFFFLIMSGGFLAGIKAKAKLIDFDSDVSSYDEIVIGSPIWNGRLTPAINTVLRDVNLDNKKVSFLLWSGSGEGKGAVKLINKKYPSSKIVIMKEPKKYEDELKKTEELE